MPIRLCLEPRCPAPATYRGRCATHSRSNERTTHARRHFYNSGRWKYTRRRVLHDQPLCPCGEIATDVDHIQAIEDGGDPWSRNNLQGLCKACHSIKTSRELRAR
jgi:5-methylcytosine-specific restriction endonuclease McrA